MVYFLHGNLQTSDVWDRFRNVAQHTQAVDLWASLAPTQEAWAQHFNAAVSTRGGGPSLLVGYSMGGRLALHALLDNPALWAGALIVAAHPGAADPLVRARWMQADEHWAERFQSEPWEALMADWESLPVFAGIPNPQAPQAVDFSRPLVAKAFVNYSKGRQRDLSLPLQSIKQPIWYICGQHDTAYCVLGQHLAATCPTLRLVQISEAGHRAPWEAPQKFRAVLRQFVAEHEPC